MIAGKASAAISLLFLGLSACAGPAAWLGAAAVIAPPLVRAGLGVAMPQLTIVAAAACAAQKAANELGEIAAVENDPRAALVANDASIGAGILCTWL